MTKFNLSIDLFTADVRDASDVGEALRGVADRLAKFTSTTWSPYAMNGTIYAHGSKRPIGTWSVDPEVTFDLKITAENDPDSRVHCADCGAHIPVPRPNQDRCGVCAAVGRYFVPNPAKESP